jgi:hypothetical protein
MDILAGQRIVTEVLRQFKVKFLFLAVLSPTRWSLKPGAGKDTSGSSCIVEPVSFKMACRRPGCQRLLPAGQTSAPGALPPPGGALLAQPFNDFVYLLALTSLFGLHLYSLIVAQGNLRGQRNNSLKNQRLFLLNLHLRPA